MKGLKLCPIERYSIDRTVEECARLIDLGLGGVALFPVVDPAKKCDSAREALNPSSLIYRAIEAVRSHFPDWTVVADLALDPYTLHGHDGIVLVGTVAPDNDATVEILEEMALLSSTGGCDSGRAFRYDGWSSGGHSQGFGLRWL